MRIVSKRNGPGCPAVGICEVCGSQVVLSASLANTCSCGAEYNLFGQRLAPRSQWGEETGESLSDILIDGPDPDEVGYEGW